MKLEPVHAGARWWCSDCTATETMVTNCRGLDLCIAVWNVYRRFRRHRRWTGHTQLRFELWAE